MAVAASLQTALIYNCIVSLSSLYLLIHLLPFLPFGCSALYRHLTLPPPSVPPNLLPGPGWGHGLWDVCSECSKAREPRGAHQARMGQLIAANSSQSTRHSQFATANLPQSTHHSQLASQLATVNSSVNSPVNSPQSTHHSQLTTVNLPQSTRHSQLDTANSLQEKSPWPIHHGTTRCETII